MEYNKITQEFVHPTIGSIPKKTILDEIDQALSQEKECGERWKIPLILEQLGGRVSKQPSEKFARKILVWIRLQGLSPECMYIHHSVCRNEEFGRVKTPCLVPEICVGLLFLIFEHHPQLISTLLLRKYPDPTSSKARLFTQRIADTIFWFSNHHTASRIPFCAERRLELYRRLSMLGFDLVSAGFVARAALVCVRTAMTISDNHVWRRRIYSGDFIPRPSELEAKEMMYTFDRVLHLAFDAGITTHALLNAIKVVFKDYYAYRPRCEGICSCQVETVFVDLISQDINSLSIERRYVKGCTHCETYDIAIGSRIRYEDILSRNGTLFSKLLSHIREKSFL